MTRAADDSSCSPPTGLSKNAAMFDTKKLEWMNGQHLSMMPAEELLPRRARGRRRGRARDRAELAKRRELASSAHRPAQGSRAHCRRHRASGGAVSAGRHRVRRGSRRQAVEGLRRAAHDVSPRRATRSPRRHAGRGALEAELRAFAESRGIAAGKIFQPLRVALTGVTASPGIFDVLVAARTRTVAGALRRGAGLARRRGRRYGMIGDCVAFVLVGVLPSRDPFARESASRPRGSRPRSCPASAM